MLGFHQVNAQHLAGVGSHADDDIHAADAIEDEKTTVVASDREPLVQFCICLIIAFFLLYGYTIYILLPMTQLDYPKRVFRGSDPVERPA
jgi:hypothetical protein